MKDLVFLNKYDIEKFEKVEMSINDWIYYVEKYLDVYKYCKIVDNANKEQTLKNLKMKQKIIKLIKS